MTGEGPTDGPTRPSAPARPAPPARPSVREGPDDHADESDCADESGGVDGGGDESYRTAAPAPSGRQPMTRTARFAWGAVAVLLVGAIVLVVYALTDTTPAQQAVRPPVTSSDVVTQLSAVPPATFDNVGVTATADLTPPTVLEGQPPLRSGGKPEVLFVGAEFCPFCAAERWPLLVALSRFGRFEHLHDVQSATSSVFPEIQSFTFVGATYTSRYVTFTGIELYSDAVDEHGAFTRIATLSPAQSALVHRYRPGHQGAGSSPFPFVDIANRMVASTSGFSPALLVGQSQATVAGGLAQSDQPVARAIVASADYLTAGICEATGGRPEAVCASRGVRVAMEALGLS